MWGRPFGQQVRAMRLLRAMSQGDLGLLLKTGQARVAQIEGGRMAPTLTTMEEVAQALGCTLVVMLVPREVSGEGALGGEPLGRLRPGRKPELGLSEFGEEEVEGL